MKSNGDSQITRFAQILAMKANLMEKLLKTKRLNEIRSISHVFSVR